MSTTIRVSEATRDRLAAIASSTGQPVTRVVDEAVDALERRRFFTEVDARYEELLGRRGAGAGARRGIAGRRLGVKPRRGEIWLVDFGDPVGREQGGRRPALVVSADALNEGPAGVVVVVPLTTTRRRLPSHVEIERESSGPDETNYAKCEDVKSVSDRRVVASPRHGARGGGLRRRARPGLPARPLTRSAPHSPA